VSCVDSVTVMDFWSQFWTSMWGALAGAVVGGGIASVVAWRTFVAQRRHEKESRYEERLRIASENVLLALAPLVTVNPLAEPVEGMLRELRARIIIYQSMLREGEAFSGDWLALQRRHGMGLFERVMNPPRSDGPPRIQIRMDDPLVLFAEPHDWANSVMQTFSGWLRGDVEDDVLLREGAELLKKYMPDEFAAARGEPST